jgi:hypothetical protein
MSVLVRSTDALRSKLRIGSDESVELFYKASSCEKCIAINAKILNELRQIARI